MEASASAVRIWQPGQPAASSTKDGVEYMLHLAELL